MFGSNFRFTQKLDESAFKATTLPWHVQSEHQVNLYLRSALIITLCTRYDKIGE